MKICISCKYEEGPLRRARRCVDNIKMDLREIGWDWIDLAHDREQCTALVNKVMNLRVP
jgi:hypothetical protein